MITEDQTAVIQFLASSTTHGGAGVEKIETHAAIVFLVAGRAYKLKRAVRFNYLDFATRDRRHVMCDAEVRLNRHGSVPLPRGSGGHTRRRRIACCLLYTSPSPRD